ncbi:hypothetical protein ABT298_17570 [Streptomyces sp. NPDC001034]|uniref:hypothetical protein n=1 Tax=Streptomyces sp. NPDC001034 TaxID=3154375 RepID=UPI003318EC92
MSTPQLAAAADGTVTAVWDQSDGYLKYEMMTATRAPGAHTPTVWDGYNRFNGGHIVSTPTRASAGSA